MSYNSNAPEASAAIPLAGGDLLPFSLEISTLEEPQSRDGKLNRAISRLIPTALELRQGILVIQRDYGKYTVRIDPEVPCGTTREFREQIVEVN